MQSAVELPLITHDLPGVGGIIRERPEDFIVDELPAYGPAGQGEHVLATIEKCELTTVDAVGAIARALGVSPRDVGTAGLKDRRAVTRQQISLPPPTTPEAARALELPGVRVIAAERHPHKLKTGHLAGNRFALTIRALAARPREAAARARAILEALSRAPGCPNWYGEQRFGASGDNAARGRALIVGERPMGAEKPRRRRLLISSYQSALFNEWLRRRVEDDLYHRVLEGDVLQPVGSRGTFEAADAATEQARLDAGEVVQTGPMFGHRMRLPPAGTPAGARERELLTAEAIDLDTFKRAGKLAMGTRRPIAVPLRDAEVAELDEAIELRFSLPPGAYATVVLREVMKPSR
jgi:tRNA pseudouridine13 synthase